MLKLIVGLGNPGQQYKKTRHNVGFWFVERLAEQQNAKWQDEKKFNARLAIVNFAGQKVYLLQPLSFMNLSGQAVAAMLRYYQLNIAECLVVHDELDFECGVIRLKKAGGHAGHNGLKSIIACTGSRDFVRLRIGIGKPKNAQPIADYVLSAPNTQEIESIKMVIERALSCLEILIAEDFERVMCVLHS